MLHESAVFGLFVVVNHIVDEIHHGFCCLADGKNLLHCVGLCVEVFVNAMPATIVLHAQVLQMFVVAWKASGAGFEILQSESLVAFLLFAAAGTAE